MPRGSKGPRLWKRPARRKAGRAVAAAVWIIKDGDRHIATGCVASTSETKPPAEAEQALADYIARKYQPERRRQDIEDIDCADVLSIYLTDIGEPGEQFEDRGSNRTAQRVLGRQEVVGGQCPDLRGLRQTSWQPRWRTPRPRDVSRRNQPSCEGRISPGRGARVASAQGRGPRPMAHAKRSSSADLALLALSGEADDPFRGRQRATR